MEGSPIRSITLFTIMINTDRLIKISLELVQIDSPSGYEKDVVDYILRYLETIGVESTLDTYGNVIVIVAGDSKLEPVILTAHLDTVEPGKGIRPEVKNIAGIDTIVSAGDTILGADNKAGVACILETLTAILEESIPHPTLEIVFTLSEEIANLGATNLDYTLLKSRIGFSFDGSGAVGTITTASPFYNRFDIEIVGKASHAGKPELGINALKILGKGLQNINLGRVSQNTLCNIGQVIGGSTRNTVPGTITVMGEVRSYLENELTQETNKIILAFEEAAQQLGGTINHEIVRENPGFKLAADDELVKLGMEAVQNLQIPQVLQETTGCYDANIFFDHKIRILNFSNGSKSNHTVNECIAVGDLVNTANIAYELATNLNLYRFVLN